MGQSAGKHDAGNGETDDTLTVIEWARRQYEQHGALVLAGFRLALVQSRVAQRLNELGQRVERMVFVGTAAGKVAGRGRATGHHRHSW